MPAPFLALCHRGHAIRAKIRNSFATSNGVNAFALNDRSHSETGYRLGGGVETMVGPMAIGLLYLYTSLKDGDARVAVTQGTAGATNPFILVNPDGTAFRRSEDRFQMHALSLTASYRFGGGAEVAPPPAAATAAPAGRGSSGDPDLRRWIGDPGDRRLSGAAAATAPAGPRARARLS